MERHLFEAMGTEVECLVEAPPSAAVDQAFRSAEDELRRVETIFSRFREDSELSELNRAGRISAGPELLEVTELAVKARERTEGRFDPTVHDALVAAGYDRSFELLEEDAPDGGVMVGAGGGVTVDRGSRRIELEEGTRLDFGGLAKGYAVDRACDLLSAPGPCLVNAGGDLAVRGRPAVGAWAIAIETADGIITLGIEEGALATSGSDRRRWRRGGEDRHHLIDPTTGRPSTSDLLRVTVAAATAAEAEILSTALFLAGADAAAEEADRLGIPAVLVTRDGQTLTAGGVS
jgi:FAD:protein FMN transferase